MTDLKEKGITVSLSTIATLIPVLAFVWFIIQPLLLQNISTAMADDLKEQMEEHSAPMESAFKVLLLADINKAKRSIAALEYSRTADPQAWTAERNQILVDQKIGLEALQEAYAEL